MKLSRLEHLYRQKLVNPDLSGKELPLDNILKKDLVYFPKKPELGAYDILEIGPGRGDFLMDLCQKYPQKKIVAVEILKKRFLKLTQKRDALYLKNLTLIHGDVRAPIENDFTDNSFEKVFILFPDPWPRNRHRHKRLLQKDFLKKLQTKIKNNGEFLLVTDVKDYAEWTFANLSSQPHWQNLNQNNSVLKGLPADIIPTFFAEKWQEMGRSFWSVRFKKLEMKKA